MISRDIYRNLGGIDPAMIEEAAPGRARNKRRSVWLSCGVAASLVLLMVALAFVLQGLQPAILTPPNDGEYTLPEGPYAAIGVSYDWGIYRDAQAVIDHADLIFSGRVRDISFAVLDSRTALPADETTPTYAKQLYTIYTVDVLHGYRGEIGQSVRVRVMGGMVGERVEEQLELMAAYDVPGYEYGIPVLTGYQKLQCCVGSAYLFALAAFESGDPTILNIDQSIYSLEYPTRKNTVGSNFNVYDTGKKDENGYPLISAKDILREIGWKEWHDFWEQWQRGDYSPR